MKKFTVLLLTLFFSILTLNSAPLVKKKWKDKDSRIEIVNEQTIIFKDVVKIEIKTNVKDQITYVYDLRHSKLVKVARGSFEVDLPKGDYLIQSDKKITKTIYDVIIE